MQQTDSSLQPGAQSVADKWVMSCLLPCFISYHSSERERRELIRLRTIDSITFSLQEIVVTGTFWPIRFSFWGEIGKGKIGFRFRILGISIFHFPSRTALSKIKNIENLGLQFPIYRAPAQLSSQNLPVLYSLLHFTLPGLILED